MDTIKQVASFKTSDGMLHGNRELALRHEYTIQIRAILQGNTRNPTFNPTEVANIIKAHSAELIKTIRYFENGISRATKVKKS